MVKVKEDMTGWIMSEHGVPDSRWIVIGRAEDRIKPSGKKVAMWLCECNCKEHTQKVVEGGTLRSGRSLSCGCMRSETTQDQFVIDMTGWNMWEHGVPESRLTVIERAEDHIKPSGKHVVQWLCECNCVDHTQIIIAGDSLRSGHTLSCGCLNKERVIESLKTRTIHGESDTRLFKIWQGMRKRCNNPNDSSYLAYGGRGIEVCKEWNDYISFATWAKANGYNDELTIERNDVNGNYRPENCRWATLKEQANNTRANHRISYQGEEHTISEWADIIGINYGTLNSRIQRGWSVERAFNTPIS